MSESFEATPLTQVLPSYLYAQYTDDEDLRAFVNSFNDLSQGYLDWLNQHPLSVYTSPYITSSLLDWVGRGIYGISRPVFNQSSTKIYGETGSFTIATKELASLVFIVDGTSYALSDDYYKRLLTWCLYRGDGLHPSAWWLKKRVARFIYGANGSDVSVDKMLDVSVSSSAGTVTIQTANTPESTIFKDLIDIGTLPLPFQSQFQVTLI